jgi:RNA polymerase-binding transcription factor
MNIDTNRTSELRQMLMARRLELGGIVHAVIRDGRQRQPKDVGDLAEDSATLHQVDLDMSLLQVRAQTVKRIDEALTRLAADQYGICAVCGLEIGERRLRALPFAVRCMRCEDRREENGDRFREFAKKGGGSALVADSAGA